MNCLNDKFCKWPNKYVIGQTDIGDFYNFYTNMADIKRNNNEYVIYKSIKLK